MATLRVVLAAPLLVSPMLVALPFLLGQRSADSSVGIVGGGALLLFFVMLPFLMLPCAIWQTGAVRVVDDVLTAYTIRDRRVLPLDQVELVQIWSMDDRGIFTKLSGTEIRPVWLIWSTSAFGTSRRLEPLVRQVADRDGVSTNPAARSVLGLPDAPPAWLGAARRVRDVAGVFGYGALIAVTQIAYLNVLAGDAPLAGF